MSKTILRTDFKIRLAFEVKSKQYDNHFISHVLSNRPVLIHSSSGGDYQRNSVEGMHFALLEWLLLSECALIVNTYGSTFAVEAAQRFLRPIVVSERGAAIVIERSSHIHATLYPISALLLGNMGRPSNISQRHTPRTVRPHAGIIHFYF
jgi:hypothetical protein